MVKRRGSMSQSNVVAKGDFERYWPDVAPLIAGAAADGLIQMLADLRQNQPPQ